MSLIALILLLLLWSVVAAVILKMFSAAAKCDCQTNQLGTDHPGHVKRPDEKQRGDSPTDEPGGTDCPKQSRL